MKLHIDLIGDKVIADVEGNLGEIMDATTGLMQSDHDGIKIALTAVAEMVIANNEVFARHVYQALKKKYEG